MITLKVSKKFNIFLVFILFKYVNKDEYRTIVLSFSF